jgi:hypothetical protein
MKSEALFTLASTDGKPANYPEDLSNSRKEATLKQRFLM